MSRSRTVQPEDEECLDAVSTMRDDPACIPDAAKRLWLPAATARLSTNPRDLAHDRRRLAERFAVVLTDLRAMVTRAGRTTFGSSIRTAYDRDRNTQIGSMLI